MTKEIFNDIETQVKKWHQGAITLHSIYIILGVTSVLSSVILATFLNELPSFWAKALAATSAASVSLIETTGVGRKGNEFRKAQRHLRGATFRFREGEIDSKGLANAFEEAETMIGDVEIKIQEK
jgi:hypothetical protein